MKKEKKMISAGDKKVIKNVVTKVGRILNTDMPKIEDPELQEFMTRVFTRINDITSAILASKTKETEQGEKDSA
jgi:hypothetical protein